MRDDTDYEIHVDQTTAYFLNWIEDNKGQGSVRRINQALQDQKYEEQEFWKTLFDSSVEDLWNEYSKNLPKNTESKEQLELKDPKET